MEPALILEGSGEELLAQSDQWKDRSHLQLMEVAEETAQTPDIDYAARLPAGTVWHNGVPLFSIQQDVEEQYKNSLPDDVVWEGTVPLIPLRGRTEPTTLEKIKNGSMRTNSA